MSRLRGLKCHQRPGNYSTTRPFKVTLQLLRYDPSRTPKILTEPETYSGSKNTGGLELNSRPIGSRQKINERPDRKLIGTRNTKDSQLEWLDHN
jgi:hypothetical protein